MGKYRIIYAERREMTKTVPVQKQDIDHLGRKLDAIIELLEKLVMIIRKE